MEIVSHISTADAIAIAAVFFAALQAVLMLAIARSVNKFTSAQNRIDVQRNVNSQWQNFNMSAAEDPEFRRTLIELGYEQFTDTEVRHRYVIFYIINILYDVFNARRRGMIEDDFADHMAKDQIKLIRGNEEIMSKILYGDRGYSGEFADYIWGLLDECRENPSPPDSVEEDSS